MSTPLLRLPRAPHPRPTPPAPRAAPTLPQTVLTFRDNKETGMELLGTDFTEGLQPQIDAYLAPGRDSIPAFLASVTLALFEEQLAEVS